MVMFVCFHKLCVFQACYIVMSLHLSCYITLVPLSGTKEKYNKSLRLHQGQSLQINLFFFGSANNFVCPHETQTVSCEAVQLFKTGVVHRGPFKTLGS